MPEKEDAVEYLRAFGYFRDLPSTARTLKAAVENEDTLRGAVLDFQNMARITATGELDKATLNKMQQPRCGVVDQGHGPLLTTSVSEPFVLAGTIWNQAIVTYRIENFSSDMNQDRQNDIIRTGFDRWAQIVPLIFREITTNDADIRIRFVVDDHGDGYPF